MSLNPNIIKSKQIRFDILYKLSALANDSDDMSRSSLISLEKKIKMLDALVTGILRVRWYFNPCPAE